MSPYRTPEEHAPVACSECGNPTARDAIGAWSFGRGYCIECVRRPREFQREATKRKTCGCADCVATRETLALWRPQYDPAAMKTLVFAGMGLAAFFGGLMALLSAVQHG